MNMKKILLMLFLVISNLAFMQKLPELNVKPIKEKGKAKIYYALKSELVYFQNTKLIDWQGSLEKLESSETYNPNKQYFIESCKFSDGKKNGPFTISQVKLNEIKTNFGSVYNLSDGSEIITGNYLNNRFNGEIKFLTFIDLDSKEGYVQLDYENGKIKDQILKYPNPISNILGGNLNFSLVPIISFKNGKVSECIHMEKQGLPYYLSVKDNNTISYIRYTNSPICYNSFSFLDGKDKGKNLINLNTNTLSIESYTMEYDSDKKKYLFEGSYRLFAKTDKLFDTTRLVAQYNFTKGKRNGVSKIWDISKNGNNGDKPYIISNYKDDLLDGKSEMYFSDGKVAVSANFSKGYLEGEAVSYYNSPAFKVFKLENAVSRWIDGGGVLLIHQIGDFGDDDIGNVSLIREKGGVTDDFNGYGIYSKMNYKIDSIYNKSNGRWDKGSIVTEDYYNFNNNQIIVKYIIDKKEPWKNKNTIWYDKNGKIVYSLEKLVEDLNQAKERLAKEKEEKNNSIVSCEMCGKKIKFGESKILYENEVRCFDNGKRVNLDILPRYSGMKFLEKPYCTEKCKIDASKECCRISGYKTEP
jgi:hypothetical protein